MVRAGVRACSVCYEGDSRGPKNGGARDGQQGAGWVWSVNEKGVERLAGHTFFFFLEHASVVG